MAINLDRFHQLAHRFTNAFGSDALFICDLMVQVVDPLLDGRDYLIRPLATSITNVANMWDGNEGTYATFTDGGMFARLFKRILLIDGVGLAKTGGTPYFNANYSLYYLNPQSNGDPDVEANWVLISISPGNISTSGGVYHSFGPFFTRGIRLKRTGGISGTNDGVGEFHIYNSSLGPGGFVSIGNAENSADSDFEADLYLPAPNATMMTNAPPLSNSLAESYMDLGAETRVQELRAYYESPSNTILSAHVRATASDPWAALTFSDHLIQVNADIQGLTSFSLNNVVPDSSNCIQLTAGQVALIPILNPEASSTFSLISGRHTIPGQLTKIELCLYANFVGAQGRASTQIYVVRRSVDGKYYRITQGNNLPLATIGVANNVDAFDLYTFATTGSGSLGSKYVFATNGTVITGVRPTDYIAIYNHATYDGNSGQPLSIAVPSAAGKSFVAIGTWSVHDTRVAPSGLTAEDATANPQIKIYGISYRKATLSAKNIRYLKISHGQLQNGEYQGLYAIKPMNKDSTTSPDASGNPDLIDYFTSADVEITSPLVVPVSNFGDGSPVEIKVKNQGTISKTGIVVSIDPDGTEGSFYSKIATQDVTGPYIGHCKNNGFTSCTKGNTNFQKVMDMSKGIVGCSRFCTQQNGGGTGGFEVDTSSPTSMSPVTQGNTKSIWVRSHIPNNGSSLGGTRKAKIRTSWISSSLD